MKLRAIPLLLAVAAVAAANTPLAGQIRAVDPGRVRDRPEEVIRAGMSRQEVVERLGQPWGTEEVGETIYLYFINNSCPAACSADVVVLRDDRVASASFQSPWRRFEADRHTPAGAAERVASASPGSATVGESRPSVPATAADGEQRRELWESRPLDEDPGSPRDAKRAGNGPRAAWPSALGVHASVSTMVDTNLYRREDEFVASGGVMAAGFRLQSNASRPGLQVAYEAALHNYPEAEEWNRVSHQAQAILARRLTDRIAVQATAEAALKGTSEDRDLGDLYSVSPRIEFRMSRVSRVRFTGAYRIRRLESSGTPNESNAYAELEFRQDLDGRRWEAFYRYEKNDSDSPRNLYTRWTFGTAHSSRFEEFGQLDLEGRYRSQTYLNRLIEIESEDIRRNDHRWIAAAAWTLPLKWGVSSSLEYRFETRASNDPGKQYDAHTLTAGLRFER